MSSHKILSNLYNIFGYNSPGVESA